MTQLVETWSFPGTVMGLDQGHLFCFDKHSYVNQKLQLWALDSSSQKWVLTRETLFSGNLMRCRFRIGRKESVLFWRDDDIYLWLRDQSPKQKLLAGDGDWRPDNLADFVPNTFESEPGWVGRPRGKSRELPIFNDAFKLIDTIQLPRLSFERVLWTNNGDLVVVTGYPSSIMVYEWIDGKATPKSFVTLPELNIWDINLDPFGQVEIWNLTYWPEKPHQHEIALYRHQNRWQASVLSGEVRSLDRFYGQGFYQYEDRIVRIDLSSSENSIEITAPRWSPLRIQMTSIHQDALFWWVNREEDGKFDVCRWLPRSVERESLTCLGLRHVYENFLRSLPDDECREFVRRLALDKNDTTRRTPGTHAYITFIPGSNQTHQ